ncbi:hypothetical protein Tco_0317732 [Tanacetum coccineum]
MEPYASMAGVGYLVMEIYRTVYNHARCPVKSKYSIHPGSDKMSKANIKAIRIGWYNLRSLNEAGTKSPMDFVTKFLDIPGYDTLWVIVGGNPGSH